MGYTSVHRKIEKPKRLESFSKNLLIGLNTIFIVFGFILVVFGVGGKTTTNRDSFINIIENGETFKITSNILIILGLISMLVGLYGLHGINTYCKAAIYTSLLLFLAILHIALGIYSTSMQTNAKTSVELSLISSLQELKQSSQNVTVGRIRESWDSMQSELRCCGVFEYRDWYLPILHRSGGGDNGNPDSAISSNSTNINNASHYENGEDFIRIPQSCFKNGNDGMEEADFNSPEFILENVYSDGCLDKSVGDLDIDRMQRVGILMAFFEILAMICAMIVTCHLRSEKHVLIMSDV